MALLKHLTWFYFDRMVMMAVVVEKFNSQNCFNGLSLCGGESGVWIEGCQSRWEESSKGCCLASENWLEGKIPGEKKKSNSSEK